MHSSRMRTARSGIRHGEVSTHTPEQAPPEQAPPSRHPLRCGPGDAPRPDHPQLPSWVWAWEPTRHAGIPPPHLKTCCKACWDTTCSACWDTTPHGQTQTTFAGGKNDKCNVTTCNVILTSTGYVNRILEIKV